MSTIATTTNASPFQYPGQTLLAKVPTENSYICLVKGTTADNYLLYRSTDLGASWSLSATIVRTNVVDIGQIFCDTSGWVFWAYRTNESSQDRIYVRQTDTHNGAVQAEVLAASAGNGGVAGAVYSGIDVKSSFWDTTMRVVVAVGTNIGPNQGVTVFALTGPFAGPLVSNNGVIASTRQWLHAGTAGRVGVSMDVQNNGNGYDGYPHMWICYGRTHMKLILMVWNGHGWTTSPGETTIYANVGSPNQLCARWDGYQMFMAVPDPVNTSQVILAYRDPSNSTTTLKRTPVHPTGTVRTCVAAFDPNTRNVRMWAVGTSTALLYQSDYNKVADTWSAWGSTGLTPLGAGADNYGAKRSSYGDARWGLYTAATGAPNTLTYTPIALAYAPNTPTWVSPASGAAADVGIALPLAWAFTDSDPGDTQGSYAISKQVGAGALGYWRASDSTWQVAEVQNTSSASAIVVPPGWAAHTDAMHTFKVKVWDAGGTPSAGYSAGLFVLPSTTVNPAITAPTPAQVLGFSSMALTWTAAEQTQYRITMDKSGILDTFSRTASSTWGSIESTAAAWVNVGGLAADFSTNGTVGQHSNGTVNVLRSSAADVGNSDQDITVDVAVNKANATTASITQWICGRYTDANNYYIARLDLSTGGGVALIILKRVAGVLTTISSSASLATGHLSGDIWRVRLSVAGSRLNAKAWPSAMSEPPLWALTVTDTDLTTGTKVAVMTRLETGNTDTTPVTSWDNLLVTVGTGVDYDGGWVGDSGTRSVTPAVTLATGDTWVATLKTRNLEGLDSALQRVYFTVSFIPPMTPTYTVTPVPASGWISVVITNPTPAGGAPAVATQDMYRRTVGDTSIGIRVGTGLANAATVTDWKAVGSVPYEYRVLTIGTTGVTVYGAWTS